MERKPEWLLKKIDLTEVDKLKKRMAKCSLHTVCEEALCPNITECFKQGQASFLILGNICTRKCAFCNVAGGTPLAPDIKEPERLADMIADLDLKHVVITSPTRDDLPLGGADYYAQVVKSLRGKVPEVTIEILIPDFQGDKKSIEIVATTKPDIIGHNLETVERLYSIRRGADYSRSLALLKYIKEIDRGIKTKSGIMVGLGETEDEVSVIFEHLLSVDCYYLSIGQYLAPKKSNYPVKKYIKPEVFQRLKEKALKTGFIHVESAPYVRSSYHADNYIK